MQYPLKQLHFSCFAFQESLFCISHCCNFFWNNSHYFDKLCLRCMHFMFLVTPGELKIFWHIHGITFPCFLNVLCKAMKSKGGGNCCGSRLAIIFGGGELLYFTIFKKKIVSYAHQIIFVLVWVATPAWTQITHAYKLSHGELQGNDYLWRLHEWLL